MCEIRNNFTNKLAVGLTICTINFLEQTLKNSALIAETAQNLLQMATH
jgi:hypothetical protein